MPAKPNQEILDRFKKCLPEATVHHTNNTIIATAPDKAAFDDWAKRLKAVGLTCHKHGRLDNTIVVSMWPLRQIQIQNKTH